MPVVSGFAVPAAALAALATLGCRGADGPKLTLRYRPPAGATYHYALVQQNSIKVETGGRAQGVEDRSVRLFYTQAVTGPTAGGTGVTLTYDSTAMTPEGMAPALDRMRGLKSDLVYDERMRVVSAHFLGIDGQPSPLTEQLEQSVRGATLPLPEVPVGIGDSWTSETELPVGQALGAAGPLKSRTRRTVKEILVAGADTSVVLSVETTFPGEPVSIQQRGRSAKLKLSGTLSGEELFSLARSTLVRSSTGGTMRIAIEGAEGMTMAVEQQTSLRLAGAP
jgi:hypothetical protein